MAKKLKAKAPDKHVWCKDSWRPVGVCTGRCKKAKKCVIFKSYQEAQVDENKEATRKSKA